MQLVVAISQLLAAPFETNRVCNRRVLCKQNNTFALRRHAVDEFFVNTERDAIRAVDSQPGMMCAAFSKGLPVGVALRRKCLLGVRLLGDFDEVKQLRPAVGLTLADHRVNAASIIDIVQRVGIQQNEVGALANIDRAHFVLQ